MAALLPQARPPLYRVSLVYVACVARRVFTVTPQVMVTDALT